MISPAARSFSPTESFPAVGESPGPAEVPGRLYGTEFWTAYAANILVTIAWALLFRYADFVTLLGGTELHLGWIVGIGMVGSVVMRFFLGSAIDRYGPRVVWLSSLAVLALCLFAHLKITEYHGVAIYAARIVFCTAVAGVFGAATTFIAAGASVERMAELIGMLGTSGFVGMMLGTQLGDLLCGTQTLDRWQIDQLFVVSGLLVSSAMPFAWWATRHQSRPTRSRHLPMTWLLRRYQPGMVLLVGIAGGAAISLPPTFLRPYAADLHITRIGVYFTVCALTAVTTRFLTRRLPDRFGLAPIILFGLAIMAVSQFLFLCVGSEWWLALPGVTFGIGQGILYPMVTAAGSSTFPSRHRGLAITLSLATFDIGQLIGAPAMGLVLHHSQAFGLPSYPAMFATMAAALVIVGAIYASAPTRKRKTPTLAYRVIHQPEAAQRNGHSAGRIGVKS